MEDDVPCRRESLSFRVTGKDVCRRRRAEGLGVERRPGLSCVAFWGSLCRDSCEDGCVPTGDTSESLGIVGEDDDAVSGVVLPCILCS